MTDSIQSLLRWRASVLTPSELVQVKEHITHTITAVQKIKATVKACVAGTCDHEPWECSVLAEVFEDLQHGR
jgi:hypothetical protein